MDFTDLELAISEVEGRLKEKSFETWLLKNCTIIYHSIEHNPHANKDGEMFLRAAWQGELK